MPNLADENVIQEIEDDELDAARFPVIVETDTENNYAKGRGATWQTLMRLAADGLFPTGEDEPTDDLKEEGRTILYIQTGAETRVVWVSRDGGAWEKLDAAGVAGGYHIQVNRVLTENNIIEDDEIILETGPEDQYNLEIGESDFPDGYLDTIQKFTEIRLVEGDTRWKGRVITFTIDDSEGVEERTLEVDFYDRDGEFTEGDNILVSFGYAPPRIVVQTDGIITGEGSYTDPLRIEDNSLTEDHLAAGSVGAVELQDDAVGLKHLKHGVGAQMGRVIGFQETTGAPETVDLPETDNLLETVATGDTITGDGADTPLEVAEGVIGEEHLEEGAVGSDEIQDDAVEERHIADGAIEERHLADGAVPDAITEVESDDSLKGDGSDDDPLGIADEGVRSRHIEEESIETEHLDDCVVTSPKIHAEAVQEIHIEDGAVAIDKIEANEMKAGKFLGWDDSGCPIAKDGPEDAEDGADAEFDGVETDETIDGDGTTGNPIGVADDAIELEHLAHGTADSLLCTDGEGAPFWGEKDDPAERFNLYADEAIFSGDGDDEDSPLGLVEEAIRETHIAPKVVSLSKLKRGTPGKIIGFDEAGDAEEQDPPEDMEGDFLESVATDGTLDGDGTTGSPIGVADGAIEQNHLAEGAVGEPEIIDDSVSLGKLSHGTADKLVGFDSSGVPVEKDPVAPGLETVATDSTLTGDGTTGDPLSVEFPDDEVGLEDVATGDTIDGDGTTGSPLDVADNAIGLGKLSHGSPGTLIGFSNSGVPEEVDPNEGGLESVATDSTIDGDGTTGSPLSVQFPDDEMGLETVATDATLTGDGTTSDPLSVEFPDDEVGLEAVSTDSTLTGDGTPADPLSVEFPDDEVGLETVATDNTISGDGTTDDPLSVSAPGMTAVETDDTLTGDGTTDDPLSVEFPDDEVGLETVATDDTITGDGTPSDPLGVEFPDDEVGLESVYSDDTLTGDGTEDSELGVADRAIGLPQLATGTADKLLGWGAGGEPAEIDPGVTEVESDSTLTGDGTEATPLGVADDAIGLDQLAHGTADKILGFDEDGEPTEIDQDSTTVTPAIETVIYRNESFTPGTTPVNIVLDHALDSFDTPGYVEFYMEQSLVGSSNAVARGHRGDAEVALQRLVDLPVISGFVPFTATASQNILKLETARLNTLSGTTGFGDSIIHIGKVSNSELRIAFSHVIMSGGILEIKVVELKGLRGNTGEAADVDDETIELNADDELRVKDDAIGLAHLAHGTADFLLGFDGEGAPDELDPNDIDVTVSSDDTIDGDGSESSPLLVAPNSIYETEMMDNAITKDKMAGQGAHTLITFDENGDPVETDLMKVAIWYMNGQDERYDDYSQIALDGVLQFNDAAGKTVNGGIGGSWANINTDNDADPRNGSSLIDKTRSLRTFPAGEYHITLGFRGSQVTEDDAAVKFLKVQSGTDDLVVVDVPGFLGGDIKAYHAKEEYVTIAASDKFYVLFDDAAANENLTGYIQLEKIS